ncbi:hypothetical protein BK120_23685 [Paenibacillus sp. FSL A5-0031]|uniref:hypothetical protein n=1 Tax=Paenibacillus sp. FSL A5-0031 TaxID=1920420 RepID=UPI00096F58B7|nr:hypothetical protein [Paenibacillus sp. FSL A5-0031]OME78735.1 hypothetical protein BK120_23685 [Paenibacillus sp. FSL A5-0031]
MTIMKITTDQIEFLNKKGRKIISIVNETGGIQIVGLENIEKLRNFLNELKETNYNLRNPFLHKNI